MKTSKFRLWLGIVIASGCFVALGLVIAFLAMRGIPQSTAEALVRQVLPIFICVLTATLAFAQVSRNRKRSGAKNSDPNIDRRLAMWILAMVGVSGAMVPIAITMRAFNWEALASDNILLLTVTIAQSILTAVTGFFLPKLTGDKD